MQAAGAGTERDVHALGISRDRLRAVPVTRPAVNAFLAVEVRDAARGRGNCLAGAELNADAGAAALTKLRVEEQDMVGVAGWRLHLAAQQQGVLVDRKS